jgi:glycosyltransferase involved in cell wall biosynthesis
MKVLLLGGANSIHTVRWANGLVSRGVDVHLVSAHPLQHALDDRVIFHFLNQHALLAYILSSKEVRRITDKVRPDLLNAHYGTGYGLLARLTGFSPTLLSVWGSDVYDFPKQSFIHRNLLRNNLMSSTAIASTSRCMAREVTRTYAHPHILITPFGIDIDKFSPKLKLGGLVERVVVGTVKTLSGIYGIDILVRAFAQAWESLGRPMGLCLEITGEGPDRKMLEVLVAELGLGLQVTFHGVVPHDQVPAMINRLDIFVALSRFESFGVAILEAAACELPVIVSDAEGLAEVTIDGVNGYIVPRENTDSAATAMMKLIEDPSLRKQFGRAGRQHVIDEYSWGKSLDRMAEAYVKTIKLGGRISEV